MDLSVSQDAKYPLGINTIIDSGNVLTHTYRHLIGDLQLSILIVIGH